MKTPLPLYPAIKELQDIDVTQYPDLAELLGAKDSLEYQQWSQGKAFLLFIARNKSAHTYSRFRNDVERFLLWLIFIERKCLDGCRKKDMLRYVEHCVSPPISWIGEKVHERFTLRAGFFRSNDLWRPFRMSSPKHLEDDVFDATQYKPSQQTIESLFVALNAFFRYLTDEEICIGNPVGPAKRDCRYLVKHTQEDEVKRFTQLEWQYVLDTVLELADKDCRYERHLFIVATMKTLFLRVSELSDRPDWKVTMGDFKQTTDGKWWLRVFGKGKKVRDITVPKSYLPFLERYRKHRGLIGLPYQGEKTPLIHKEKGRFGLTTRQLTRLVQVVFDKAYESMRIKMGPQEALKLKQASTHYLRHTGASMEVERGRPLKDLSEDLGHASSNTTDTIYSQTERKKRAQSGEGRDV